MTISQMSRLYGVSLRTLRFYEDRGLIKPRREGNARYYRSSDRTRMDMIVKGKKLGFTLTEISDLIGGKGRKRNARPRGAPAAAADRQPDQPPRAAAGGDRQRDHPSSRHPQSPGARQRRVTSLRPARGANRASYAPTRAASTMRSAAATAASMLRGVVSSRTASSAARNGAAERPESRASRLRISDKIAA